MGSTNSWMLMVEKGEKLLLSAKTQEDRQELE